MGMKRRKVATKPRIFSVVIDNIRSAVNLAEEILSGDDLKKYRLAFCVFDEVLNSLLYERKRFSDEQFFHYIVEAIHPDFYAPSDQKAGEDRLRRLKKLIDKRLGDDAEGKR